MYAAKNLGRNRVATALIKPPEVALQAALAL
jgi:hypothetical protein